MHGFPKQQSFPLLVRVASPYGLISVHGRCGALHAGLHRGPSFRIWFELWLVPIVEFFRDSHFAIACTLVFLGLFRRIKTRNLPLGSAAGFIEQLPSK